MTPIFDGSAASRTRVCSEENLQLPFWLDRPQTGTLALNTSPAGTTYQKWFFQTIRCARTLSVCLTTRSVEKFKNDTKKLGNPVLYRYPTINNNRTQLSFLMCYEVFWGGGGGWKCVAPGPEISKCGIVYLYNFSPEIRSGDHWRPPTVTTGRSLCASGLIFVCNTELS